MVFGELKRGWFVVGRIDCLQVNNQNRTSWFHMKIKTGHNTIGSVLTTFIAPVDKCCRLLVSDEDGTMSKRTHLHFSIPYAFYQAKPQWRFPNGGTPLIFNRKSCLPLSWVFGNSHWNETAICNTISSVHLSFIPMLLKMNTRVI